MGLDWLDGYVGLTPALKQEAIDLLVRWSDYCRDEARYRDRPKATMARATTSAER